MSIDTRTGSGCPLDGHECGTCGGPYCQPVRPRRLWPEDAQRPKRYPDGALCTNSIHVAHAAGVAGATTVDRVPYYPNCPTALQRIAEQCGCGAQEHGRWPVKKPEKTVTLTSAEWRALTAWFRAETRGLVSSFTPLDGSPGTWLDLYREAAGRDAAIYEKAAAVFAARKVR